jgi:hypothetical protein
VIEGRVQITAAARVLVGGKAEWMVNVVPLSMILILTRLPSETNSSFLYQETAGVSDISKLQVRVISSPGVKAVS